MSRKIPCIGAAAVVAIALAAATPRAALAETPNLVRARLSQAGRKLVFSLRTSTPLALANLHPRPQAGVSGYVCLELSGTGPEPVKRLCLGGRRARRQVGLVALAPDAAVTGSKTVAARLLRPEPRKLVVALFPGDAGLGPQRYRWRVIESLGGCQPGAGVSCESNLPSEGTRVFRLRPVRAVGCATGGAGLVTNGSRERRVVALTFDDGPSEYTSGFLDVLRREKVPGTFFEIGQEMLGRESTMRRILREGGEIGDHTMHHTEFPGFADIAATAARIEAITHFRPCLFRPPGGALDSAVVAAAAAAGMRTITWDVDPVDWSTPGTSAIYNRIVDAAQPGSIVLMHDGGGNRSETLAALPHVIDALRARGYRFETVTRLLGGRMIYRPYG